MSNRATDAQWFRQVLGQYPTGVCAITATQDDGQPAAMIVGSFTSVSLDPPLVAFLPDRNSSSWAKLRACRHFCVNILGAEQESLCRQLASRGPDKFSAIPYRLSPNGAPILGGAVAWIDCETASIQEAGDHHIVLGNVRELGIESGGPPLLFFQGGYGRFEALSLAASDLRGAMTEQLRIVDVARPDMERLAEDLQARCVAALRLGDELVVAASAGQPAQGSVSTLVGQRFPFVRNTSSVFIAWSDEAEIKRWIQRAAPSAQAELRAKIERVRERGYSLALENEAHRTLAARLAVAAQQGTSLSSQDARDLLEAMSYDPPALDADVLGKVRMIGVPVFGPQGDVVLQLTVYEFSADPADMLALIDRTRAAAQAVTSRLGSAAA